MIFLKIQNANYFINFNGNCIFSGRMLPVWLLILPTVTHGILQYLIGNAVSTVTSHALRRYHKQDQQKQVTNKSYTMRLVNSLYE